MPSDIFKQLNPKQQDAVKHTSGPSVILAGAGSGKTRVLVYKVIYLVKEQKVPPGSIVMITFTNKAANEMKQRIRRLLGENQFRMGYVGTFHSFCSQILRRDGGFIGIDANFNIYDDDDQSALLKSILKKKDGKKFTPSFLQYRISAAKNQLISPQRYSELFADYSAPYVAEIYDAYQKELMKNKALDFDDLIMQVFNLFIKVPEILGKYQERYRYLLVDEFQDTNYAQYALTRVLGGKYRNVSVVGDFSQSIYSWRGADIRNLEKFKDDFPESEVFSLDQNYRSTQNILSFAYGVISKNETHPILQLHTDNTSGEEIVLYEADNEQEEALYIASEIQRLQDGDPYTSFAVLYRTNAQSRVIEEAFLHYSIPYTLVGGTRFYERKEIKDILSYLRLLINPQDEIATERIKKIGKKYWDSFKEFYPKYQSAVEGMTTIDILDKLLQETNYLRLYNIDDPEDYNRLENIKELKSVAIKFPKLVEFLEQVALVESEYFDGEKKGNEQGVRLMTLHQAKGLEFPYVFIVGLEEGLLPHSRSVNDLFELEEERRLFYVGITRAQKKLYITYARRRFIFGRRGETVKSRFINNDEQSEPY